MVDASNASSAAVVVAIWSTWCRCVTRDLCYTLFNVELTSKRLNFDTMIYILLEGLTHRLYLHIVSFFATKTTRGNLPSRSSLLSAIFLLLLLFRIAILNYAARGAAGLELD